MDNMLPNGEDQEGDSLLLLLVRLLARVVKGPAERRRPSRQRRELPPPSPANMPPKIAASRDFWVYAAPNLGTTIISIAVSISVLLLRICASSVNSCSRSSSTPLSRIARSTVSRFALMKSSPSMARAMRELRGNRKFA